MNCTIQRCFTLTCRNSINFDVYRRFNTALISCERVLTKRILTTKFSLQLNNNSLLHTNGILSNQINSCLNLLKEKDEANYAAVQLKKRPKKRKTIAPEEKSNTVWNVKALATSEEYNLEALVQGLLQQNLYSPSTISTSTSCEYLYQNYFIHLKQGF